MNNIWFDEFEACLDLGYTEEEAIDCANRSEASAYDLTEEQFDLFKFE